MTTQRDLRLDFFRGLALLIVVVDHLEEWAEKSVASSWTLISLGFSDAGEIFVFLAGFVFAVAYSRSLEAQGLLACVKKAARRSLQIYLAYLLASATVIGIGAWLLEWNPPTYNDLFPVGQHALSSLLAAVTLRFHPFGFDILALYVLLMPAMAVMLFLQRRVAWLAWALSLGLYLLVQFEPGINLARFGGVQPWYFNPLAWQFLFFLGMYFGDPRRPRSRSASDPLFVTLSAMFLLAALFVMKFSLPFVQANRQWEGVMQPVWQLYRDWSGKTTLQPLRLIHFFALACVTARFLPPTLGFWATRWARPVIVAGQHSLEVYAFGLVLSFLGVFAIQSRLLSTPMVLLLDALAIAGSLAFGYLIDAWKRSRRPRRPSISPPAPAVAPQATTSLPGAHRRKTQARRRSSLR